MEYFILIYVGMEESTKKRCSKDNRGIIKDRVDIDKRPKIVDKHTLALAI